MLLSAVSVLLVAQSSSEIPEGLMNNPVFRVPPVRSVGRDSVVGIATGYELDGLEREIRDLHFQTGPGAHLASYTMGTESFPR